MLAVGLLACSGMARGDDPAQVINLWPDFAPGETTRQPGTRLPTRADESPPATRIGGITQPQLVLYPASPERSTGTGIVICPGGGYNYVVTDKEGSEAAAWLNELGISAFVLRYRTKLPGADGPHWQRPLQDAQRALRIVRGSREQWALKTDQIGILGFSAGGQLAALTSTRFLEPAYAGRDQIDELSARPDFSLLVYPWQLVSSESDALISPLTVTSQTPPMFLVHAHNDSASSLSSIALYTALKRAQVPAELHVYETGGHGYGMRPVADSYVDSWPDRASDWLVQRKLGVRLTP